MKFDAMEPEQEALAISFCEEIRLKGVDPVRLLEMAEALSLSTTAACTKALKTFLQTRGETAKADVERYFITENPNWLVSRTILRNACKGAGVIKRVELGRDESGNGVLVSYWRLPGQPATADKGILPPDAPKTEPDEGVIDAPADEMALTDSEQRAISKAKARIAELRAKYREKPTND